MVIAKKYICFRHFSFQNLQQLANTHTHSAVNTKTLEVQTVTLKTTAMIKHQFISSSRILLTHQTAKGAGLLTTLEIYALLSPPGRGTPALKLGAPTNFRARRKLLISVRPARKWFQHVKG